LDKLFEIRRDPVHGTEYIETSLTGHLLLEHPILNKGSAFTETERREFGLTGLLPSGVSTLEVQLERIYGVYRSKTTDLERYMHLTALQDRNETAFYGLLSKHLAELMPIIYTPVVGAACQSYSRIYHRPRGVYIPYSQRHNIDEILANVGETDVQVIVVTDGERILGLGDLGIGGMGIPVGKLSLYTVCAGIHPSVTLPIVLDIGTNNRDLLDDPLYLGERHERIRGRDYDDFIEAFVAAVQRRFPRVLLQWEDFAKSNAARLLDRYRNRLCTFNDDIQGTGAVTLAAALAAVAANGSTLADQRIVLLGAGSAATGITSQLVTALQAEGLSEASARSRIWLVDSQGLVHSGRTDLEPFKREYARAVDEAANWQVGDRQSITLLDVVKHVHPTILIGTAAQPRAFDENVVREMAQHAARPIIFPLSNPTSKCEGLPADMIAWSDGRALVATGSPFEDVIHGDRRIRIAQCNNAYIFPGVGLGVIAAQAQRVTDSMFVAAARALSEFSPARKNIEAPLLPALQTIREVSRQVALAVAREAQRLGVAEPCTEEELSRRIASHMWTPQYLQYRKPRRQRSRLAG
jgi:malate dehydrogenase (oxaloacetate-decarboxylating)